MRVNSNRSAAQTALPASKQNIDTAKARAATRLEVHRNETRSATVINSHLAYGLAFRNHFTAATVVSNTPVTILPSDFVCTQMRYGPDFGNAYGNETSPEVPTLFVWLA